jgi:hypothetical protein
LGYVYVQEQSSTSRYTKCRNNTGFIRFDDYGYPNPKKKESIQPQNTVDKLVYAVRRTTITLAKRNVREMRLISGKKLFF